MAATYVLEQARQSERVREITFAGDNVRLAGQMNYPSTPPPFSTNTYPMIFVLHHAGGNTRKDYEHYARIALKSGFAVFRWDKRGTGRSGAGGRGSTTQDAVMAYEAALDQPNIDWRKSVVLAQNEGTLMLGESFGLFARHQPPAGVVLAGNMLNEKDILAIDSKVLIVNGEHDWNDWMTYAQKACDAHNGAYRHGAGFYVAHNADRILVTKKDNRFEFHAGAMSTIRDWLQTL